MGPELIISHAGPVLRIPVGTFPKEHLQFVREYLSEELGEGVMTLWLRRAPSQARGRSMQQYLEDRIPRRTLRFGLVGVEERYAEWEDNVDCTCLRTALDRVALRYEKERVAGGFTMDWKVRVVQDLPSGAEVLAWMKGQCYPITETAFGCLMLYLYPPKPKRIVAVGETVGEYGKRDNPIQGLTSDAREEVDRRSFTDLPT